MASLLPTSAGHPSATQPQPRVLGQSSLPTLLAPSISTGPSLYSINPVHSTATGVRSRSPGKGNYTVDQSAVQRAQPSVSRQTGASVAGTNDDRRPDVHAIPNINRWSQSTASSKRSSTAFDHTRSSLSKRLSGPIGAHAGASDGFHQSNSSQSRAGNKRARSPGQSAPLTSTTRIATHATAMASSAPNPPLLPPIARLGSFSESVDTANSPALFDFGQAFSETKSRPYRSTDHTSEELSPTSPRKRPIRTRRDSKGSSSKVSFTSPHTPDQSSSHSVGHEAVGSPNSTFQFSPRRTDRLSNQTDRSASNSIRSHRTLEGERNNSENQDSSRRGTRRRAPSQKALLSKALAKANHAVVLDGKQNIDGAILAYSDACSLLRQVMIRSSGEEDRRKLEAVRNTYRDRITELQAIETLAEQPRTTSIAEASMQESQAYAQTMTNSAGSHGGHESHGQRPSQPQHSVGHDSGYISGPRYGTMTENQYIPPPRRQSLHAAAYKVEGRDLAAVHMDQTSIYTLDQAPHAQTSNVLVPPALAYRTQQGPAKSAAPDEWSDHSSFYNNDIHDNDDRGNDQHTSWLNTINESSGSSASTTHSCTSSVHSPGGLKQRLRAASGTTEAEFDAALDAAIETAYDEGFEPDDEADDDGEFATSPLQNYSHKADAHQAAARQSSDQHAYPNSHAVQIAHPSSTRWLADSIKEKGRPDSSETHSSIRRHVELARENVREVEREAAIAEARKRQKQRLEQEQAEPSLRGQPNSSLMSESAEAEAEERMLDDMTRNFLLEQDFDDAKGKSNIPRQSDSSSVSGRTWGAASGSFGSNPASAGTSLSTLAEHLVLPSVESKLHDSATKSNHQKSVLPPLTSPPPMGALPKLPHATDTSVPLPKATQASSSLFVQAPPRPPTPPEKEPDVNVTLSRLAARTSSPGVRDRRLSGLKAKQLKIDTGSNQAAPGTSGPKTPPLDLKSLTTPHALSDAPRSANLVLGTEQDTHQLLLTPGTGIACDVSPFGQSLRDPLPTSATFTSSRKGSFPLMRGTEIADSSAVSSTALTKVLSADSETVVNSAPSSPARTASRTVSGLRKNFSSSSLRSRALSAGAEGLDTSPNTSISSISSAVKVRRIPSPAVPMMPTPIESNFAPRGQQSSGGIYLFDDAFHCTAVPGTPNTQALVAPTPLEPCPDSPLLRPFWFLRQVFQTIANPRGGYLTTRMFVPRDIWRVKNIKLKNVEEKVSTCDLLTAALLKLGKVDMNDKAAVLEEMQFLENVMDRAQANLSKKLGNSEVGLHGALASFKTSNTSAAQASSSHHDDSASNSEAYSLSLSATPRNKSYLKSWRKLRSKSSMGPTKVIPTSVPLPTTSSIPGDGTKLTNGTIGRPRVPSIPMADDRVIRPYSKRDISSVQCVGPNPSYMGAVARLCDAVQVIDRVIRQLDDPGHKRSSQTYFGLELSTRHAAEFFAFYICRFVFGDISLMLDKFIKRGSEWVLSTG